eukprot:3352720-Rhodomonas_salina.2
MFWRFAAEFMRQALPELTVSAASSLHCEMACAHVMRGADVTCGAVLGGVGGRVQRSAGGDGEEQGT